MEYLPDDPHEKEYRSQEKLDKKLRKFREYIVDKGIVLAFSKVLLSLKYSEVKPKNPIKAIRDFFGEYHDTEWDAQDALKEQIILYNQENPILLQKVLDLEEELENAKRDFKLRSIYKGYDVDPKTVNITTTNNKIEFSWDKADYRKANWKQEIRSRRKAWNKRI